MQASPRIIVLGAGPAGLGAAWRLQEMGCENWRLVEAQQVPGGLAGSVQDAHGFTWDYGGHVLFSHYEYFDTLMTELLRDAWVEHIRDARIWMQQRLIPYPLQYNLHHLAPADALRCLEGLLAVRDAGLRGHTSPPDNFASWIAQTFGDGLTDLFMRPYNAKVWAFPAEDLDACWVTERVAAVDFTQALRRVVLAVDDDRWGPNASFRFPLHGGTGAIWETLARRLSPARLTFGLAAVRVDMARRIVHWSDGTTSPYDFLISTVPLDGLIGMLDGARDLTGSVKHFKHSSVHVVGVGVEAPRPAALDSRCWTYFPEPDVPFYRVTVFSNYSPHNVQYPDRQWSLMCEVSESCVRPVDGRGVVADVVAGLERAHLLDRGDRLVTWHRRLEHAYPTPFNKRDEWLGPIDETLRAGGIWSRGRFGGWKYEVGNQDHALMQGVEAVDHLLRGAREVTYPSPEVVNRGPGKMPVNESIACSPA